MSREKQIEEMRYLADEMGKAISTEIKHQYIKDERKLEEVLKANGWCKASEVVEEIFAETHNKLLKILKTADEGFVEAIRKDDERAQIATVSARNAILCAIHSLAELKKKFTEEEK